MILHVFSVKDEKAGCFVGGLQLFPNESVALRAFTAAVNDRNGQNLLSVFPEDSSIFKIGTFDDQSGVFTPKLEFFKPAIDLKRRFKVFRSCYKNLPKTVPVCSGSMYRATFGFDIDPETGEEVFVQTGEENLYLRTQESKPKDIYQLLEESGVKPSDIEAFMVARADINGLVDDFSKAPRSLLEAHFLIHRAEGSFDNLSSQIKEAFNGSRAEF